MKPAIGTDDAGIIQRGTNVESSEMKSQENFWNWFILHEPELFAFDPAQEVEREELFSRLARELEKIDRDLAFEFGPKQPRRDFVISAGGIKRAFPSVTSLVNAAPRLDRWQVIAFRPRRTVAGVVQLRGKRVDVKDVQFSLLDNGKTAGIYLFIPGYQDADVDLKQIGYLLLDEALGEYDVESKLGLIKMLPPDVHTSEVRHPLVDLPVLFDGLTAKLEGRSGKAS